MRSRLSTASVCAGLALALAGGGCRVPTEVRKYEGKAARLREENRPREAAKAHEEAARFSSSVRTQRENLFAAARLYVAHGDQDDALRVLGQLRSLYANNEVPGAVYRLIGEAHFETGSAGLARRYLSKGLGSARGEDRERTLARLAQSARGLGQHDAAAAYLSRLSTPHSEGVARILRRPPPTPPTAVADARTATPRLHSPSRPSDQTTPYRHQDDPGDLTAELSAIAGSARLVVIPRSMWNARPVKANVTPMGRINKITIHHSAGEAYWGKSLTETAHIISSIQRGHQRKNWADIGYHYVIDRQGNVWQGRPLKYQGAHARGNANRGNIGIVVLGNYTFQRLTVSQRKSLTLLLAKLCNFFKLPPSHIYTHKEILHGGTACPGPELSRYVSRVRDLLHNVAYRH